MKEILIATKNKNKFKEVKEILKDFDFIFKSLSDFPDIKTIPETGKSFKENAELKAASYSKITNSFAIADDSGLEVDFLDGQPGVYSSRFAGEGSNDLDNNKKLLKLLKEIPGKDRTARFVCYIAIADCGNIIDGCIATCEGYIAKDIKGRSGFGYDPVFVPKGYDKTFAELGSDIKNRLSHRYKALLKTKEKLKDLV